MLFEEEHGKEPLLASLHSEIQHLLQWHFGLHRWFGGKGERQQGQLHRDYPPLPRRQPLQRPVRRRQFRPCHRKEPESHQVAQHQQAPRMDEEPSEDRTRHRVAQPQRIQPHDVESLDADGPLAVSQRCFRRSRRHLFLYEPSLPDPAHHLRQVPCLARQVLHPARVALRRRGRHPQHEPRLHRPPCRERMGLHLRRLLYPHWRIRESHPLPTQGDQARDAPEATRP